MNRETVKQQSKKTIFTMRFGRFHYFGYILPFALLILLSRCSAPSQKQPSTIVFPETGGALVVDTIIYPVTIINPDSLDTWTDFRLKRLDHKTLINYLFESLYSHKISAYNYYNHDPVPAEDIKEMEASGEIKRSDIAQLQFEEAWFFNAEQGSLTKKVHSILLALPVFDDQGQVKGYKAAFVLKLTP